MLVNELLRLRPDPVVALAPWTSLSEAARTLKDSHVHAAVVLDGDERLVGILSENDVTAALAEYDARVTMMPVEGVMTDYVVTCSPYDGLDDALKLMDINDIRHLPVVEDGTVLGVLTLRDVAMNWLGELQIEIQTLEALLAPHTAAKPSMAPA